MLFMVLIAWQLPKTRVISRFRPSIFPLSFGVNFLSFAKIVSLRAYISAMPSFTLGVSDNRFGISKDNVNPFIFYGQIGIGADIAFLLIDLGYNYGTQSLMKNSTSSTNPGQFYLNLGFRF
ncbi:MAG: hypothetical protein WDM78_01700 [Puia sp.]